MALAGCVTVLASVSRAAGLLCVVLGLSFACSPIPYNTTSDSPFARPVTPEDLYYEEAEQGPPRIEPGDSLEVVVRRGGRSEEHTSELQSLAYLVCRLLLEKKKHYELY